jgi:hypothetical protein
MIFEIILFVCCFALYYTKLNHPLTQQQLLFYFSSQHCLHLIVKNPSVTYESPITNIREFERGQSAGQVPTDIYNRPARLQGSNIWAQLALARAWLQIYPEASGQTSTFPPGVGDP